MLSKSRKHTRRKQHKVQSLYAGGSLEITVGPAIRFLNLTLAQPREKQESKLWEVATQGNSISVL